jgi:hypothetical protein
MLILFDRAARWSFLLCPVRCELPPVLIFYTYKITESYTPALSIRKTNIRQIDLSHSRHLPLYEPRCQTAWDNHLQIEPGTYQYHNSVAPHYFLRGYGRKSIAAERVCYKMRPEIKKNSLSSSSLSRTYRRKRCMCDFKILIILHQSHPVALVMTDVRRDWACVPCEVRNEAEEIAQHGACNTNHNKMAALRHTKLTLG